MKDKTEFKIKESDLRRGPAVDKRPCLIMIEGDYLGEIYPLEKDLTIIGRSDDVDIIVSDTGVSRRHSMIVKRRQVFFISDLGSTNGTEVNGQQLSDPWPLEDGDKVRLADVSFKFCFQDANDTQYHRQLRDMAVKDGLTRIYNKRFFTETLEKEFEFSRRQGADLSLIIFDIDNFKILNDTYGHPGGDYVLKRLAALLDNEARGYDVFARFGGEEFVFLLRGARLEAAVSLADRIRVQVEAAEFQYDEHTLKVTISLGCASYHGGNDMSGPDDLVTLADRFLYEAKSAGRNCLRYPVNH